MEDFRVRLNCVDHYQSTPSEFDPQLPLANGSSQTKRSKVPIIRVFGATETGQRVCAHVHGAFPYLYIEYDGDLSPDEVDTAIRTLHLSIDRALAVSYRRNVYEGETAFVAHITLVKGIPFYGYHVGYKFFFKIYLFDPMHVTRLSDLLRQGAVMNRSLQPYESHMQYVAQWMCDYNLYGCDYINCSKVKFRRPIPSYDEANSASHRWHDRSIPLEYVLDRFVFPKQSHCTLEVDVHVQDITNRQGVKHRALHHDFVERSYPILSDEKLLPSLAALWEDETERRKKKLDISGDDSSPFSPAELVSMSADTRKTGSGGWVHEDQYRQQVATITINERLKSDGRKVSFGNFVEKSPFEANVISALDSVRDLFPGSLQAKLSEMFKSQQAAVGEPSADIQVDESRILSLRLEDLPYESDSGISESLSEIMGDEQTQSLGDPNSEFSIMEESGDPLVGRFEEKMPTSNDELPHTLSLSVQPTALLELENMDIRKFIEPINSQEDVFEIDDEFIRESSPHIKQVEHLTPPGSRVRTAKRIKLRQDDNDSVPLLLSPVDTHVGLSENLSTNSHRFNGQSTKLEDRDIGGNPPSQPRPSRRPRGNNSCTPNQKIPFPVVKDPNDPATLLRLSQQTCSSSKGRSQSSKQVASSPGNVEQDSLVSNPFSSESLLSYELKTPVYHVLEFGRNFHQFFSIPQTHKLYSFLPQCPSLSDMRMTINDDSRPSAIYQRAYYSNDEDVPDRPRDYAGREFKLESNALPYLPPFNLSGTAPAMFGKVPGVDRVAQEEENNKLRKSCTLRTWEFLPTPPSLAEITGWVKQAEFRSKHSGGKATTSGDSEQPPLSQIDGPTQKNPYGFKYSQRETSMSFQHETIYMSVMSLEVHINTRGTLAPNPKEDEISCVFWCVQSEVERINANGVSDGVHVGILALAESSSIVSKIPRGVKAEVQEECTELDLITRLVDIVRYYDPDILTGYEVHNSSWGYLIERARHKFDYDLCDEFSRVKTESHGRFGKENDRWGFTHTSTIRVTGRHMINIWRAMRSELNLLQYTIENVVFHLLHRRIPHYHFQDLTKWYKSCKPRYLAKVIDYFVSRVQLNLEILESNELISRTSEQARLLGIDFFSVFSRGSQFKVESLMLRIAKPENFILISPSKKQVGQQNALECIPLVMEPQSDFYTSPLLVLDFQSLYPSIMIAYNYCYSTFLGRVISWRGQNKMGFTNYQRRPRLLELFRDQINIAPNGIIYAKPEIRKSLLAKMLSEILETRVMVKGGMTDDKDDKNLQRLLNNRQLALKFIANVTYGYTSASFSGRMPCVEIADSIVQTARETLERAIAQIHSVERWGAEVVYGDTDSLFIYLKGRTRDEAFDVGEEISKAITNANPRPVKLKFEKVYHPCVLLAKKRYVGYMYESRSQKVPQFDAKGMETVRRDGTPAEQKIEEKALKILFETADLSRVKRYFQNQCSKIMQGKVSIQDFCFAKEVRLGTYNEKRPPPPGALISAKRMLEDSRLEPQYGERVPYVVVSGAPGARLIDRCVAPEVLLQDAQMELDSEYYISKNIIPPLERIFNLVGANVRQWYDEMPKYQRIRRIDGAVVSSGKDGPVLRRTLESYLKSSSCIVCREKLEPDQLVCCQCLRQPHISLLQLKSRLIRAEKKVEGIHKVCRSCMGVAWGDTVDCDSKDCPVFYSRTRQICDLKNEQAVLGPVVQILEEESDNSPLGW